jgi:hypothetical protein
VTTVALAASRITVSIVVLVTVVLMPA